MREIKEQKNKLKHFVIFSIIFHIFLFSFIILCSLNQIVIVDNYDKSNEAINTVTIVDPGAVIKQYNQLKYQQNGSKQAIVEREEYQRQNKEPRKQQEKEQKHLKVLEEEQIKIEQGTEQQRNQVEEIAQENKEQQKVDKNEIIKSQTEQGWLIKKQKETKLKITEETQAKKKVKLAKVKLESKRQATTIDSLLTELTDQYTAHKTENTEVIDQVENKKGNKKNEVSNSDIADYISKVKASITNKFYDSDIFHGKICELNIKLDYNGILISITPKSSIVANDQLLCNAAIRAAKTAVMPKPPSRSIYNTFNKEGSVLIFRP